MILGFGIQTYSYSPGLAKAKPSHSVTELNGIELPDFLNLNPKKYYELTGKKMTLKEKISLSILKAKLKKQLPDEEKPERKRSDVGLLSLIFGGAAFVVALIPGIGIASLGLAIAAIVLGIIGLSRKKGDTKSLIGLILGSVFFLLLIVAIAAFAAGWN